MMQSNFTVMIADHNDYDRKAMRCIVEALNCEVVVEENDGSRILEQYKIHKPNLLILDIVMPSKTGHEVLQEIFLNFPTAFVIVFSSISDLGTIENCIELGVANYILKNTSALEVQSILEETIASAVPKKDLLEQDKAADERRRHRRFHVIPSLFGVLPFAPIRIGKVLDVSVGGLAFQYTSDSGSAGMAKERKKFPIEIFRAGREMEKVRISCEAVYDASVSGDTRMRGSSVRRCGVRFIGMSERQRSQLRFLIQDQISL